MVTIRYLWIIIEQIHGISQSPPSLMRRFPGAGCKVVLTRLHSGKVSFEARSESVCQALLLPLCLSTTCDLGEF